MTTMMIMMIAKDLINSEDAFVAIYALLKGFINTRSSTDFKDLLDSSITPHFKPHWMMMIDGGDDDDDDDYIYDDGDDDKQ